MAMMSPKAGNGLYRPLAEINVTPLVDVMLVLLIIFMVTAPMLASGMKVNLPQAKQIQPLDPKAPIIITVGKDSTITLGSDTIERDKLIDAIQMKLAGDTTQVIHLRGDKEAAYGDVVAIMDLLATNGLTHIAIVADPHSKQDPAVKPEIRLKAPSETAGPEAQVKPSGVGDGGTPGSVNATDSATSSVSSAALPPAVVSPAPIAPSVSGASQP